jgi:hypothetical protein
MDSQTQIILALIAAISAIVVSIVTARATARTIIQSSNNQLDLERLRIEFDKENSFRKEHVEKLAREALSFGREVSLLQSFRESIIHFLACKDQNGELSAFCESILRLREQFIEQYKEHLAKTTLSSLEFSHTAKGLVFQIAILVEETVGDRRKVTKSKMVSLNNLLRDANIDLKNLQLQIKNQQLGLQQLALQQK